MTACPDYIETTLDLRDDEIATLIELPADPGTTPQGAILYLHGFVDYFFQDHVATHFAAEGWAWYALELRRYGRSLREGDEPWYTTDLTEYYEELDRAIEIIRAAGHTHIILMGHSTGGLVSVLWAHDRRDAHPIDGLVLNSPWLDLQEPWFNRNPGTWLIRAVGAIRPMATVPQELTSVYPQSLHTSAHGEWDFNLDWKPLDAQPVRFGFLAAVRHGHARLHRGLDVGVPVLLLRSDVSRHTLSEWSEAAQSADTVLNVEQMHQWLPSVGGTATEVVLPGALHDVMLSALPVRTAALDAIDDWLPSTR